MSYSKAQLSWSVVSVLYFWLVCTPYIVYQLWRFRRFEHHPSIQKRQYQFVYLINVAILVYVCISRSINTLYWCNMFGKDNRFVWDHVWRICFILSCFCVLLGCLFRIWHLLFDIHWALSSINRKWVRHIDPRSFDHNFWIQHRHTLGTVAYTLPVFFLPSYLFLVVTLIPLSFYPHMHLQSKTINFYSWFMNIFILLHIGIGAILWCRLPKFYDSFHIRSEIRWILITGSIGLGLSVLVTIIFANFKPFWKIQIPMNLGFATVYTALTYYSTQWVLKKNGSSFTRQGRLETESHTTTTRTRSRSTQTITSRSGTEAPTKKRASLGRVLSRMETLNEFMKYLLSEFSSENLLAFIELTQYRLFCSHHFGVHTQSHRDGSRDSVPFANIASPLRNLNLNLGSRKLKIIAFDEAPFPQSCIVYSEEMPLVSKVIQLIEKYLLDSSPFALNVPYDLIKSYEELYWTLVELTQGKSLSKRNSQKTAYRYLAKSEYLEMYRVLSGQPKMEPYTSSQCPVNVPLADASSTARISLTLDQSSLGKKITPSGKRGTFTPSATHTPTTSSHVSIAASETQLRVTVLFDAVLSEVYDLMADSFSRFRCTQQYAFTDLFLDAPCTTKLPVNYSALKLNDLSSKDNDKN